MNDSLIRNGTILWGDFIFQLYGGDRKSLSMYFYFPILESNSYFMFSSTKMVLRKGLFVSHLNFVYALAWFFFFLSTLMHLPV